MSSSTTPKPGEHIRRAPAKTLHRVRRSLPPAPPAAAGWQPLPRWGLATLPVLPRSVAVFFTGDELRMPGEPLPPGAIYNSNRFALVALLERLGCEVRDLGLVPDQLEPTRRAACGGRRQ